MSRYSLKFSSAVVVLTIALFLPVYNAQSWWQEFINSNPSNSNNRGNRQTVGNPWTEVNGNGQPATGNRNPWVEAGGSGNRNQVNQQIPGGNRPQNNFAQGGQWTGQQGQGGQWTGQQGGQGTGQQGGQGTGQQVQGGQWTGQQGGQGTGQQGGQGTGQQGGQVPWTETTSPAPGGSGCSCVTTAEYNPVCGSDNATYSNPGRFNCAARCRQRNGQTALTLVHYGVCRDAGTDGDRG